MNRRNLVTLICVGLVLLSCALAARVWSPAVSGSAACRQQMQHIEGYGPWHMQTAQPFAGAPVNATIVTYFDGYNSASCLAQQRGPIWMVVSVGQTMVGCSLGLTTDGAQACPRKAYGVAADQ